MKRDCWMQDGHSTACMCVFWGRIYVDCKDSYTHMHCYNANKNVQLQTSLVLCNLTPQLLLMAKTR